MKDDGGPAFPVAEDHKIASDLAWTSGMTLRDWFAGQFLVAIPHVGCGAELEFVDLASDCYKMADAMLAERAKQ